MPFSIARAPMLELLAQAMGISAEGRSAFLGRFQHLQRLRLIEGINPGRGKAAEYGANHTLVIALTMQMLQLGLTPERAVAFIKNNEDYVRLAIDMTVRGGNINPTMVWFDPCLLSRTTRPDTDLSDYTFDFGSISKLNKVLKNSFEIGYAERLALISVSNTLWNLAMILDGNPISVVMRRDIGTNGQAFIDALVDWVEFLDPHGTP